MWSELPVGGPETSRTDMSALGGLLVALLVLFVSLGAVASLPGSSKAQALPVAIVFAPWVSAADATARSLAAGHRILRSGRASSIVVVAPQSEPDGATARPDGALFVVSLSGLAGCLDVAVPAEQTS